MKVGFLAAAAVMVMAVPSKAETVLASYYWQGQKTATGARFDPNGMTAAHRTLPFGTKLRVTYPATGKSVVVVINDRGPFVRRNGRYTRDLDLSRGAAARIGMIKAGVARVEITRF
jgi:rare lipoprotein A